MLHCTLKVFALWGTEMFHRKHPSYGCKNKTGDEGTLAAQGSVEWVNFLLPPSQGKSFNDFSVSSNILMIPCLTPSFLQQYEGMLLPLETILFSQEM